jgi:ABC-type branched-subunit amino acid transport system substrate-binding protein
MKLVVAGLERAGRDLTREKFLAALESLKGYTADGLLPPISFGPDRHHGGNAVRMMRAGKASDSSVQQIVAFEQFPPRF